MASGTGRIAATEIEAVLLSAWEPDILWGADLDQPKPGARSEESYVDIVGWVVGRRAPAVAVEVLYKGEACRRVPIAVSRPDVARRYPQVPDAESSGFATRVGMPGMGVLQLSFQAVLSDQSRVPVGVVRAARRWRDDALPAAAELVSVIIPCCNQAHYLSEAIESVLAQTYPNFEIIVVDDGSADNTEEVAARYPGLRYVRQANGGLSAARNRGVSESRGGYLVFLDSDDRLLPDALAIGLGHFAGHPECAFVAGRHRVIGFDGSTLSDYFVSPSDDDLYRALLRGNFIGMHAAVMYQRFTFESIGGFDTSLRSAEDYDLYMRVARSHPFYWHEAIVAEYRRHGSSMTVKSGLMLKSALHVLRSQPTYALADDKAAEARRVGIARTRARYGDQLARDVEADLSGRRWGTAARGMLTLLRHHPAGIVSMARTAGLWRRREFEALPKPAQASDGYAERGEVDLGVLRRLTPVSRVFGFDRGLPVDRHYIEDFLVRHTGDIRGRVLEVGDASYTRRFGGHRVSRSDVLHIRSGNPHATIIADLSDAAHIPSETFDCIILTQTLHLIYDVQAAVRTLYRILKPAGVLLATVPGTVTQIALDEWGQCWNWGFTSISLRRLMTGVFPQSEVQVEAHGNVLVAVAALHGLAAGEVSDAELAERDAQFEVLLTARAVKPVIVESEQQAGMNLAQRGRPATGPLILLYHRIASTTPDPWGICVSPEHFAEHLEVIRRHADPVRLHEAASRNADRPARTVAVTFDDGYADNLYHALPLLERQDITATLFVATGYIASDREFWWDELMRHVLEPPALPPALTITLNGATYEWSLGDGATLTCEARARYRSWRGWEDDPTPRHFLYRSLWQLIRPLPHDERRRVLDQLSAWAGTTREARLDFRALTGAELATLASCDLVELGCHTRTHPVLSSLEPPLQRDEIVEGKRELEALIGIPARSFAYPFGRRIDYSNATVALARDAGFECACSNFPGFVSATTDPFELPRIAMADWDGDEFERRLSGWFHGQW